MAEEKTDPFGLLLENLDIAPGSVNLASLAKDNHRSNNRLPYDGQAIVYDSSGKLISKAVLRNVSPGGAGFEVNPIALPVGSIVTVEFGGSGFAMGIVTCKVQWIGPIDNHPKGHKMIGLQFWNVSITTKAKLDQFFEELKKQSDEGR
ncbi:MAG: PilZ domain-containing protein [Pseudobdellovibrionaceae bacterium]